jgi:hypothetical protein
VSNDWRPVNPKFGLGGLLGPRGLPVGTSPDLARVLALPRRPPVRAGTATAEALVEIGMRRYGLGPRACACRDIDPERARAADLEGRSPCVSRLLWLQAWMLHEITLANGLIANAAVGGGKGLVNILAPLALRLPGDHPLCLLLVPPSLLDQITTEYQLYAEHFRVPGLVVHLPGKQTWQRAPRDGEPMLHVVGYSKVSGIDNSDLIERLRPDAIIADECDSLGNLDSARCLRFGRFMMENEHVLFCGWTGSLTDRKLLEFAHLSAFALGDNSPLPLDREVTEEWGRCIDDSPTPCPPGALARMLEPGEHPSQIRTAFRRRLAETPGFILVEGKQTISNSAGEVELVVREKDPPEIPQLVLDALDKVRDFVRPDTLGGSDQDEILVDPLEQARCAREVATGVFYRWIFPRGEKREVIQEWYEARKAWNSELRRKMLRGEVHLDSPKLCENAARRAWGDAPKDPNLPEWKAENWPRWRDVEPLVEPKTQAVRLHPFLAEDAARWGMENTGQGQSGIIWYTMVELAQWIAELSGYTLPVHGGGPGAGKAIAREDGSRSIIASIKSHGRGRDRLQYSFARQLMVNMPSSDRVITQLLGRLHRRGQPNAVVDTEAYLHTDELRAALRQALRRGRYVQEITGEERKLLSAWTGDVDDEP